MAQEKKLTDILGPLVKLQSQIESVLSKLPKVTTVPPTVNSQEVWGKLLPQFSGQPPISLSGSVFTIGRNAKCNLPLKDNILTGVLGRLHFIQGKTFIESNTNNGSLSLNHRTLRKPNKLPVRSGDEISITGSQTYSYIFQQIKIPKDSQQEESVPMKRPKLKPTSKIPVFPSEKTVLSSPTVSNIPPAISVHITSPTTTSTTTTTSTSTPSTMLSPSHVLSTPTTAPIASTSPTQSPSQFPTLDPSNSPPSSPFNKSIPPTISVVTPEHQTPPVHESDESMEESLDATILAPPMDIVKDVTPTVPDTTEINVQDQVNEYKQQYVDKLLKSFIKPDQITTSFDSFPYHVDEGLKNLLINSVYLFLEKPSYIKFTKLIAAMSRRILLVGPKGTQILQDKLVEAIAKHFKANLLVLDDCFSESQKPDAETSTKTQQQGGGGGGSGGNFNYLFEESAYESSSNPSFKKGDKVKYVGSRLSSDDKRNPLSNIISSNATTRHGPFVGCTGKVVLTFDDNPRKVGVRFDKPIPGGINLGQLCEDNHGFFVEAADLKHEGDTSIDEGSDGLIMEALFSILSKEEYQPSIIFIKNFDKTVLHIPERFALFKSNLEKMENRAVFIASSVSANTRKEKTDRPGLSFSKSGSGNHTAVLDMSFFDQLSRMEERKDTSKSIKVISKLFPCKIHIHPPKEQTTLAKWEKLIQKDQEKMKSEANFNLLMKVLTANSVSCPNLDPSLLGKKVYSRTQIEKVVGWAVSHHIMHNKPEESENSNKESLVIEQKSISVALKLLEHGHPPKLKSIYDIDTDNEFEKRLLSDVIPPNDIPVSFDSIGALDSVKATLKELVMLPLQRPELFRKGNLTKPCKGILLFGPPGTGKTMLAKAVATESGANFISISMASIGSKWFGEGEKYARAVFTLASKISPCVIFIDEVDSILGRREKNGEHEAMRKIKNELMMMWDGLKTRQNERVLVLAATNRPFDLDDAVLRRLPRRLLVDLPDVDNRSKILKVVLKDEEVDNTIDLSELAKMTEGYSGSDLHNLCVAAAYQPIREFLSKEKGKTIEEKENKMDIDADDREAPTLRPLSFSDFENAKKEISASVSEDAQSIGELRKWNDLYGEGGSRRRSTLSYFV
eukprot:TRINITY_DN3934_c0_g1_i1.p1 TRINITY_DN3934_c0_g1~~TRINITY_DN3934_c0_g1_i1.p1  ORF type:complete len:1193 (-),score=351.43 TRINITY_DN3934_c0_g1_i1:488-3868(-)